LNPVSQDKDREELALERTHFAEDRTIMAMERTFAGWMRTAFAAIGIGLAFHVVFGKFEPPWLARAIATVFILAGAWLAIAAERRACRTFERLRPHQIDAPQAPLFKWLGWAVAGGALVLIAGLWVLNDGSVAEAG
jgi:putative membrane protein